MNRLWRIFLTFAAAAIVCSGCSDNTEELNQEQQEDIVSFLESSHDPKLIPQSEVEESLVENPPFYVKKGGATFRYIQDYYNADRASKAEVKRGSRISITFELYDFSSTDISSGMLLYTNNAAYKEAIEEAGLNTAYWNFEPKEITVGSGALFGSVESLLVGCSEGDVVEFYLTLNMAYGNSFMGVAPLESPVALFLVINSVEN